MSNLLEDNTDEDLMKRVLNGDHQAFSALVTRHTDKFYALAWRIVRDDVIAEDIVQDAFLKLWRTPDIWDAEKGAKFTTWFYRIVYNRTLDILRKTKRIREDRHEDLSYFEDDHSNAFEDLHEKDQNTLLQNAIKALPERQKTALTLCVYEELSQKEAAHVMEISVKALESLLIRAKAGLKDYIQRLEIKQDKSARSLEGKSYG